MRWTITLLALLSSTLAQNSTVGETESIVGKVGEGLEKVVSDIKEPVEETIISIASSQCANVKKLAGVSYEQIDGENEPDLSKLTLLFVSRDHNATYNITDAAQALSENPEFNPQKELIIFIHGFEDDPSQASFTDIRNAFLIKDPYYLMALDCSSLIRYFYLRSTTYVRFIGQKLGEELAAMMQHGLKSSSMYLIGHSLGAHICGYTGKTFTNLTGEHIGRISGLDPAGPCYSELEPGLRLNSTDADFVDVIHTDSGVYGIDGPVGQVDYFPNKGSEQPNCVLQTCSHSRSWQLYAETVLQPNIFPAVKCDSWDAFKKGQCSSDISYMGYPSKPGTRGLYFLQTSGDPPYGLGDNGTKYNDDGIVKTVSGLLG